MTTTAKLRSLLRPLLVTAAFATVAVAVNRYGLPLGSPVTVTVVAVARGDVTGRVIATGPVQPSQEYDVTAPVSGILKTFALKEGDRVAAGQVIARLQQTPFRLALAQAQSQLAAQEAARAQLQRRAELADGQAATLLAAAQTKLALAKSQQLDQEGAALRALTEAEHAVSQATFQLAKAPASAELEAEVAHARKLLAAAREDLERVMSPGATARLQVTMAELDLAEAQNAIAASAVLPAEITAAGAAVEAARQAVVRAQEDLAATTIVAPSDGVVLQVFIREGGGVTPGLKLLTLASPEKAVVRANVDESDIDQVKLGQRATITSPSVPDLRLEGTVTRILPRATTDTANATVIHTEIEFRNTDGKLRSGMNADLNIAVAQRSGVFGVPVVAVRSKDFAQYVLVVEGNVIRKRTVTTGVKEANFVEIIDDLQEGEYVVTGPEVLMSTLRDGQTVTVGGAVK